MYLKKQPPQLPAPGNKGTRGGGEILCNRTVTWKRKEKKSQRKKEQPAMKQTVNITAILCLEGSQS